MAFNFPSSPSANQIYTDAMTGIKYQYNSTYGVWRIFNQLAHANNQVLYNDANTITGNAGLVFEANANTLYVNTIIAAGRISDNIGDVRNVPVVQSNSVYVISGADVGKTVNANANVLIPNAIFTAGQTIGIFNRNTGTIYVEANSVVNVVLAGTTSYGTRAIAQNGLVEVYCLAANTFVISGSGLT